MINAGHAAMHQAAAVRFIRTDWLLAPETTFSIYGERGSIDILAHHPPTASLLVVELKTDLVDVNGLMTAVDRYRRLAPDRPRPRLGSRLGVVLGRAAGIALQSAPPRRSCIRSADGIPR